MIEELPKEVFRVADQLAAAFFSGRLSLVETVLGESHVLGLRIEQPTTFRSARYGIIQCEDLADSRNGPPDSESALVLCLSGLERKSL